MMTIVNKQDLFKCTYSNLIRNLESNKAAKKLTLYVKRKHVLCANRRTADHRVPRNHFTGGGINCIATLTVK